MLKVHGYLDDILIFNNYMGHLPHVGDTMRFSDTKYGKVTEVIWCMDEKDPDSQRINLRIESI